MIKIKENKNKKFYKRKSLKLSKKVLVNLYKIEKLCKKGDKILVPGIVLGEGEITKPITVYALRFSKSAKEKISSSGGNAIDVKELKDRKGIKIIK